MVGWVSFLIYSIPTHWRTVSVFIDKVYVCFIYIRIDGATRPSAKIRVVAGRLRWWNWKGWEGWANCRSGSWTADARPQIENDRKDGGKKEMKETDLILGGGWPWKSQGWTASCPRQIDTWATLSTITGGAASALAVDESVCNKMMPAGQKVRFPSTASEKPNEINHLRRLGANAFAGPVEEVDDAPPARLLNPTRLMSPSSETARRLYPNRRQKCFNE